MQLVDTHVHLDQEEFDADRAEVIARAHAAGVSAIVAIGTTAASSESVVKMAAEHPGVFAAVGIQPNYCVQAAAEDWERIVELARRPGVVAIGETGLDRYWDYTPFAVQQDYFDRHIDLAARLGLPFVVHMRDCGDDILAALRAAHERHGSLSGVMHSFTGDADLAEACVELGLYISFAGMATFKKSAESRAVAAAIPADRILVETDSPYLSPEPYRGKRNEPAHVVHTAACLAAARGETPEAFAEQTTANARRLFRLER
ncbi:MAG: hydrolase TatD [Planctomycetota bacterium]|nr:MAG: hydrolase TatD [Planctomycetota bacterium]